nr:ORF3 [Torque teno Leptonychotes weddellii virus 3]WCS66207.1 ORF3 [Torque teno Leptonychotes weddellii virus 3]WCS66219.1 ORF3 [Torque teno Leptonychotes weddellii virus 3]WCS66223.1 ORF3 [Torque teno Leptonychotes weddellii virus 3]
MTSYRETSTKEASSQTELWQELLDLCTPEMMFEPPISPPISELSSISPLDSEESEFSESFPSSEEWEDESNPGGEGPPLVPPEGGNPSTFC